MRSSPVRPPTPMPDRTHDMLILHANWTRGHVHLWGESLEGFLALQESGVSSVRHEGCPESEANSLHRFAVNADELHHRLSESGLVATETINGSDLVRLKLPKHGENPQPSHRLVSMLGALEAPATGGLAEFAVPMLRLGNDRALAALIAIEDADVSGVQHGQSLRYWIAVARFILELLADQRFIPTLFQARGEGLRAAWQPWLHDRDIRGRVGALIEAMPPIARAAMNGEVADESTQHQPWRILSDAMKRLTDATVRSVLSRERFIEAIDELDPASDAHVAWLSGLLGQADEISLHRQSRITADALLRDAGRWVAQLDETEQQRKLRLCLRLNEPEDIDAIPDGVAPDESIMWRLSFHLQQAGDSETLYDAESIWRQPSVGQAGLARPHEQPQEILLAELGRAARIYSRIEEALSEPMPTGIDLSTREAYEFLREHQPVLEEAGVRAIVPDWWKQPFSRLGARLQIDSPSPAHVHSSPNGAAWSEAVGANGVGLHAIVSYSWQVALGDHPLSLEEFQRLAAQKTPLVRMGGRWVEIRPDDMQRAAEFLAARPGGDMTLLDAIRLGSGVSGEQIGLPIVGLDSTGWVSELLDGSAEPQRMSRLDQPVGFHGELRPYQRTGLSWLAFLDRFGLGACLADDMGLGKTIQLIALLQHEREFRHSRAGWNPEAGDAGGLDSRMRGNDVIGPTLLVVPTSVVSNWVRELGRFSPELRVHVQHGPDRPQDEAFEEHAARADVVITTYALVSRDKETLHRVQWHRIVLDEAQYIKNPPTKQTAAIRSLPTTRRLALTGTPVENRLSELWSIMEFCNPGYLGPAGEFRSQFSIPIERHRDQRRAESLRRLVRPFVLRRLKTDPRVITDLPPLVESKEFATLTPEQAALYEQTVGAMLNAVDRAGGMQRRGLVLATLVKLKQICNHPAQFNPAVTVNGSNDPEANEDDEPMLVAGDSAGRTGTLLMPDLVVRSGKTKRLLELLEEVLATGERALIFTQFRKMGHLLTTMIRSELDCEALFLHGGTPQAKRQQMIDRFQSDQSDSPIFVLSLRAGGVGLNLTAANHVFHFDRWWNPAVENQATDRAFRIGQTRTVHVHKFICAGTLEERIDQMIEQKTELAQNIIGAGETWLTELDTGQLRDLLTLRRSALEVEE